MAAGTKEDPWELKTPPGTSSYTMYQDEQADPPALVCQVGSTTLKYQLLEELGLAEVTHDARNNRMRAI